MQSLARRGLWCLGGGAAAAKGRPNLTQSSSRPRPGDAKAADHLYRAREGVRKECEKGVREREVGGGEV